MSLLVNFNVFGSIFVVVWSNALFARIEGKPLQSLKPGCRYEGRRYQEGSIVTTSEPCLQCRCLESSLRCRLRVCPRIPNPPPPECHLRPAPERVCCAEMVCGDPGESENSLRKMDLGTDEDQGEDTFCLYGGARYGPGSAMVSTRRCEYCYCISGARRCVRPKCLLALPGCVPMYAPHSCCPVAYNCTLERAIEAATTPRPISLYGCRVGNRSYEGEMVRDIERRGTCDNCFCAMGVVRCVPLSCAPPLRGCSPIVKEGHCCPSTYNCSGSIEAKATQNYASYAFVSKDYANFRKETNFRPVDEQANAVASNAIVEGRGHRVIDGVSYEMGTDTIVSETSEVETTTLEGYTLDEQYSSTKRPEVDDMPNEIYTDLDERRKYTTTQRITTNTLANNLGSTEVTTFSSTLVNPSATDQSTTSESPFLESTASTSATTFEYVSTPMSTTIDGFSAATTTTDLEFDSEDRTRTTESLPDTTTTTTDSTTEGTTWTHSSVFSETTTEIPLILREENRPRNPERNDEEPKITEPPFESTTFSFDSTTSQESTQLTQETPRYQEPKNNPKGETSTTLLPKIFGMGDVFLTTNVTLTSNVSVGHTRGVTMTPMRTIPPDVEAILNITQRVKGEDYDYYSEPTLPPSLPNVRIIPFVAADALVKNVKDTGSDVDAYPTGARVGVPPELHPTDGSNFYDVVTRENRFSPPVETEGGFVPRDPPYFEPPYHSTDLNLEIGTGVTVLPGDITNTNRKAENGLLADCLFETRRYRHGELIPNNGICVICICYYGEVVCSDEKCPPLKIGCRRLETENECCGKLVCVDTAESPTMVLDRADATAPVHRQPITFPDGSATPDPFRDVIKTKPAPDLPSLIEDMIPYLVEHQMSTPRSTTPMTSDGTNHLTRLPTYNDYLEPNDGDFSFSHRETIGNAEEDERTTSFANLILASNELRNVSSDDPSVGANVRPEGVLEDKFESHPVKSSSDGTPDKLVVADGSKEDSVVDSFDDVFDLLFGEAMSAKSKENPSKSSETLTTTIVPSLRTTTTTTLPLGEEVTATSNSASGIVTTPEGSSPVSSSTTLRIIDYGAVEPVGATKLGSTHETKPGGGDELPKGVGGLLKLAGCNIYGRMYRVGKIITELSGPCFECRCTGIGVQCEKLSC